MDVFGAKEFDGHEEVLFCTDKSAGLRAIIAVHDTTLGPAVGGCRMAPYANEELALADVLRLSRGMTYKSAMAGLNFGGGKSVIIGDPRTQKTPALLQALARHVDSLGGRYVVGADMGTNTADVEIMGQVTAHVAGRKNGSVADTSAATAWGVFHGIRAALSHKTGRDSLAGVAVAVQGVGRVGLELCRLLREGGAKLIVADLSDAQVRKAQSAYGAAAVSPDAILRQRCHVLAPCAAGGVINDGTLRDLRASIVAGAANNQLSAPGLDQALAERGVLYAPDFAINAGGVIAAFSAAEGQDTKAALARVAGIHDTLMEIFRRGASAKTPPGQTANNMVRERLAAAREGTGRRDPSRRAPIKDTVLAGAHG
jgi:leucine dehydrogenase